MAPAGSSTKARTDSAYAMSNRPSSNGRCGGGGDEELHTILDAVLHGPPPGPLDHPLRPVDPDHAAGVVPGQVRRSDADPAAHLQDLAGLVDVAEGQQLPRGADPARVLGDADDRLEVEVFTDHREPPGHPAPGPCPRSDAAPDGDEAGVRRRGALVAQYATQHSRCP